MARRKKEPEGFHRDQIAEAAGRLFAAKGIEQTTMDEVAAAAGYSKATVYVYFRNKEELAGELALRSMRLLKDHILEALTGDKSVRERYDGLCRELTAYQKEQPYYFRTVLGRLNVDFERQGSPAVDREIFLVGEEINRAIAAFLDEGIRVGVLRPELDVAQTVFVFWSALSGLILVSADKEAYVSAALHTGREEFLAYGFDLLYRSIERRNHE